MMVFNFFFLIKGMICIIKKIGLGKCSDCELNIKILRKNNTDSLYFILETRSLENCNRFYISRAKKAYFLP